MKGKFIVVVDGSTAYGRSLLKTKGTATGIKHVLTDGARSHPVLLCTEFDPAPAGAFVEVVRFGSRTKRIWLPVSSVVMAQEVESLEEPQVGFRSTKPANPDC